MLRTRRRSQELVALALCSKDCARVRKHIWQRPPVGQLRQVASLRHLQHEGHVGCVRAVERRNAGVTGLKLIPTEPMLPSTLSPVLASQPQALTAAPQI